MLKILALEPNGFAISQRLKRVSGDVLQVSDGSLPGFAQAGQEGSDQRPREAGNWNRLSRAISHVVKLKEA